jgi:SecD/SecF fusion protein
VMTVPAAVGPVTEIAFDKPTSLSYMRELFDREFRLQGAGSGGDTFTLTGVEESKADGRFKRMVLNVSKNPTLDKLAAPDADPAKKDQVGALRKILDNAKQAFDSTPEPERLEVFDSQLASETRTKASYAIIASWIAIMLYLWFRFGNWTFGLAAVLCLVHDLFFTLGCIAGCHYIYATWFGQALLLQDFKIDLPSIAALLTLVGYSVNDTIVVFDRIREVRGKNPALTEQIINDSVNQTLSRTILASLTTFLVVVVLYWVGGEGVHLFAFVMVVGVIVGTYSSIYIAAPLLLMFGEGRGATVERPATSPTPATTG